MDHPGGYTTSTSTAVPLIAKPDGVRTYSKHAFDSFRKIPTRDAAPTVTSGAHGRVYNAKGAASNTATSPLVRRLKGRHLQMIAIGGSIGTGLFIGSGGALAQGGPASLLMAFILIGVVLYCTVHALGEMAVAFPVAGSFSAFSTRFIDPAWGFAMGWNYALQWMIAMPVEVMAASITIQYWNPPVSQALWITIFLALIIVINLAGVRTFGEAEYFFSIMKVTAVIGFIILGVVINCGGSQDSGYIGGKYWSDPGAFNNGFKGFCSVLVTAAFSFAGTELVGLAAAETANPSRSLPTAIKQVFWRIAIFYVTSIFVVGLLVPYNNPSLISASSVDSKASPFIIAISSAGISGLDSVMNAIVLIAVLSVGNSSLYGASRTLAALAEQGQAPKILAYIDREGRPLVSIAVSSIMGLLAYLSASPINGVAFTWLVALSGLSSVFTWLSICVAHIRFRSAWAYQGRHLDDLVYRSPLGIIGSWIGIACLVLILAAQFWVAIAPVGTTDATSIEMATSFFEAYLAAPLLLLCYIFYKVVFKTKWARIEEIDLQSGGNEIGSAMTRAKSREDQAQWPRWKVIYKMLC